MKWFLNAGESGGFALTLGCKCSSWIKQSMLKTYSVLTLLLASLWQSPPFKNASRL